MVTISVVTGMLFLVLPGTFLGGHYSLSKMGGLKAVAVTRGWTSWALWTGGAGMRWTANITELHWRVLLPLSAALQLIAFLIFFATVSRHKSRPAVTKRAPVETWMKLVFVHNRVLAGTVGKPG